MVERILIPLDGSELAQAIIAQVRQLLLRRDSEVLLVRAVEVPTVLKHETVEVLEVLQSQAVKYLDEVAEGLSSQGARVRRFVRVGSAAQTILDVAGEERVSLIAMTTHGRTGWSRWMLGSVAVRVVRSSRVPVLLVRAFEKGRAIIPARATALTIRKILFPTDGSPASLSALALAQEFADLFGSEIVVLHVEVPIVVAGSDMGVLPPPRPTPSLEDPLTEVAAERLSQAKLRVERLTVYGDPAAEILDESDAAGIDLIVMATHGRSGLSRALLGSVAERVLSHAKVPLLLIRAGEPGSRVKEGPGKMVVTSP